MNRFEVDVDKLSVSIFRAYQECRTLGAFLLIMENLCDWESLSYNNMWTIMWKLLRNLPLDGERDDTKD